MGVKTFRVGGEGLVFVVTDFFAVSGLGSAWSIAGGRVGPLGRMLWLTAVRLGISV